MSTSNGGPVRVTKKRVQNRDASFLSVIYVWSETDTKVSTNVNLFLRFDSVLHDPQRELKSESLPLCQRCNRDFVSSPVNSSVLKVLIVVIQQYEVMIADICTSLTCLVIWQGKPEDFFFG